MTVALKTYRLFCLQMDEVLYDNMTSQELKGYIRQSIQDRADILNDGFSKECKQRIENGIDSDTLKWFCDNWEFRIISNQ